MSSVEPLEALTEMLVLRRLEVKKINANTYEVIENLKYGKSETILIGTFQVVEDYLNSVIETEIESTITSFIDLYKKITNGTDNVFGFRFENGTLKGVKAKMECGIIQKDEVNFGNFNPLGVAYLIQKTKELMETKVHEWARRRSDS